MEALALDGGFANGPVDAATAFRRIMTAMARPGNIEDVSGATPPAPLSAAAGTALLTLCDPETPIYLAPGFDTAPVRHWITFHTGAPFAKVGDAMFAVGRWDDLPITEFQIGTPEYPDRSATLIVEMDTITAVGATLRGPGIRDTAMLSLPDVKVFQSNALLFPLGLDFLFTAGGCIAALPRSTKVS